MFQQTEAAPRLWSPRLSLQRCYGLLTTALLALALPVGSLTGAPSPAQAATKTYPIVVNDHGLRVRERPTPAKTYCVLTLPGGAEHCSDTLQDHIKWVTKGEVTGVTSTADLTPKMQTRVAKASNTYVIGKFYDRKNASKFGQIWEVRAAHGCAKNGRRDWQIGWVGDAWNDRISSFIGMSNCTVKVWEHANYEGASSGYARRVNNLGALNDQTSSIAFS